MNDMIKDALSGLCDKNGSSIIFDEQLSWHSAISTGGKAAAWYEPLSPAELRETLPLLRDAGVRTIVIGNGSNVLMPDEKLEAVVISLSSDCFTHKRFKGDQLTVGAGEKLSALMSLCCARGLSGLEGLVGIPGTVGGALVTNASYKSTISDCLLRVKVIDRKGNVRHREREDLTFGYRKSSFDEGEIIIEAVFKLKGAAVLDLGKRLKDFFLEKIGSQPLDEKTLGCIFKNPKSSKYRSAELIEMAGMKGRRRGGAVVSEKHANFIVNSGRATSADIKTLIREIKDKVRQDFSVELAPEIEIL